MKTNRKNKNFRSALLCGPALAALVLGSSSFGAALDPPQVVIRAIYKNSFGTTVTYPDQLSVGPSGTVNLSATTLFGSQGVPKFEGGAIATVALLGRTDDTAAYTPLDSTNLASWLPSVAMRWQAEWYGVIEQDKLAFVYGNDLPLVKGPQGLNLPATITAVSPGPYRVRADQRLGFSIAGAQGPGHGLLSSTDPLRDQVVVERYWQAYDLNTWSLVGSPVKKRVIASDSRTFSMLRLGSNSNPQGLDVNAGGVAVVSNPSTVMLTFNESGGSDPRQIAGRETFQFRLAPFLPDNPSGLDLGTVSYNVWPQTVGSVTLPPTNVVARDGSNRMLVTGTSWSLPVSIAHVYPGAEVYARIIKSDGSYNQLVTSWSVPVTSITGTPSSPSGSIPGSELMPAIASPNGVYNLRVFQSIPGQTTEVLVDLEYVVQTSLNVNAVIGEIAK